MDADTLARNARRAAAREAVLDAEHTLTVRVDAFTYGFLCAGGIVHHKTPDVVAALFLEEKVTAWSNDDFILED